MHVTFGHYTVSLHDLVAPFHWASVLLSGGVQDWTGSLPSITPLISGTPAHWAPYWLHVPSPVRSQVCSHVFAMQATSSTRYLSLIFSPNSLELQHHTCLKTITLAMDCPRFERSQVP